jgi:hypothetical protein
MNCNARTRRVQPGTRVRYVARVRKRRRAGGDRLLSSLWDGRLTGILHTTGATRPRRIRFGPGRDRARRDRADRLRACERIRRG